MSEAPRVDPPVDPIEQLVHAVLYEGYALYPYRPSALKNAKRFAFGVVYPQAWAVRALEPSSLRTEIVVEGQAGATLALTLRFLRLARGGGAVEESLALDPHALGGAARVDRLERAGITLEIERTTVACEPTGAALWRCAFEIRNVTALADGDGADREAAMDVAPASTHLVIRVASGTATLLSAIDPPAHAVAAVAACRALGLYPILAGVGAVLASPIILPDFPEIAPQSPGEFFDGTEIDEMLTLRVLTMTDAEKREASAADPRIAALIARTEALGIEHTAQLHGLVKTSWPRQGTRVRLHPNRRADAFDMILAGKLATVATVERDLEGRIYCAVTIDDDPGAALGVDGMPGHRFFFAPDELEVLA